MSVDFMQCFFIFILRKKCRTSNNIAGPVDPRCYWSYRASNMYGIRGTQYECRISKMPVQNSNFKISAHPDLATNLLQILLRATFNSLV